MNIIIKNFKPMSRNSLRGFVTVDLPEIGLAINDISVFENDKGVWISLPSKARIKDGQVIKDQEDKIIYDEIISFSSSDVRKVWSDIIIDKVKKAYPESFNTMW